MNDPKKKIGVSMSSLDRLKAELLRKQEEIKKAKIEKPIEKFVPKKAEEKPKVPKEKSEIKSKEKQPKKNYEEYEDSAAFEKAKRVLQAKAKFYDKMVAAGGSLNSDDNCLVLFNRKKQDEKLIQPFQYEDDDNDDDDGDKNETDNLKENKEDIGQKAQDKYETNNDSAIDEYEATEEGDDWVEYTDCLGRTRKCLRKDFVLCKQKDSELAKTIQPREVVPNLPSTNQVPAPSVPGSMSSLEESVRTKYDEMKVTWEKKEKENLEKEFIHYQDVFFDEARQHGVGYYAFSTDDEERARQLRELYELRAETLEEQKKHEAERQQRDIILSERVRAAENRLRARQGLPPLEDDPAVQEEKPLTKEERKLKRKEEKLKRRQEKEEKLKDEERKNYIRPWDKQKVEKKFKRKNNSDSSDSDSKSEEDDEWKYKPQREPMSQEQWNEKQRSMRNPDFAPPSATDSFPQNKEIRIKEPSTSFPNNFEDLDTANANPFYFTTKKRPFQKKLFVRKNYAAKEDEDATTITQPQTEGIPIHNEIPEYININDNNNDDDIRPPGVSSDDDIMDEPIEKRSKGGVEIPPPPTFEYYGPTSTSSKRVPTKKPDIESSIEAGLKFLRNQSDKGLFPTKYSYGSKET